MCPVSTVFLKLVIVGLFQRGVTQTAHGEEVRRNYFGMHQSVLFVNGIW